jgi:hypothetical protein
MVKQFHTRDMPEGSMKEAMDDWCNNCCGHTVHNLWVDEEMQETDEELYEWVLQNGAELGDEITITNK